MLKNQTVNHVSEHLSAICPVYTNRGRRSPAKGWFRKAGVRVYEFRHREPHLV